MNAVEGIGEGPRQQEERRQGTLDFFLTGDRGVAVVGFHGRDMVRSVFQQLQRCDTPMGKSARGIASSLPAGVLRGLSLYCSRGNQRGSGGPGGAPAVAHDAAILACLIALESSGMCYRTYDDDHFLATSDQTELSRHQLESIAAIMESAPGIVQGDQSPGAEGGGPREGESAVMASTRGSSSGSIWRSRRGGGLLRGVREVECTGRAPHWLAQSVWERGLRQGKKARLLGQSDSTLPLRVRGVWGVEYNSTGEFVMAGCGFGWLTVFKCSQIHLGLRDTWSEASRLQIPPPARHVKASTPAEILHWNPHNRNEVGSSGKGNGDVNIYDFKSRGRPGDPGTPCTILSHKQGHGMGGVLDFEFFDHNVVVGGFQTGAVALWDKRSPKAPKSVLSQGLGGVCYARLLSDGSTLVGGTTGGAVQIWDIRRAVRNMSVMKMGGKDDVLLASLRVEQQIPLLNAEGQICEGRFLPPPEFGEPRTFAVEPSRESQVAMAIGTKTLCIVSLVHSRVSHVYTRKAEESPHDQHVDPDLHPNLSLHPPSSRPSWINSCGRSQTLAMGGSWGGGDGSVLTLVKAPKSCTSGNDGVIVMQHEQIVVPGGVSCVAGHPTDSSFAVGFKDGSLWTLQLGGGLQE